MTATFRRIAYGLVVFLAIGVALVSYRYLVPGAPGGAPNILANRFTHLGALGVHAGFAATALLIGGFQFLRPLRARWPAVHRWTGQIYVASCLAGGAAGLLLSFGTTAGPVAGWGFALLALTWLAVTANGWRLAQARDFARHERWMIRSFALTLAAVTLRLYLPLSAMAGLPGRESYLVIAWLCWVPNLIAAEAWLALAAPRRGLAAA